MAQVADAIDLAFRVTVVRFILASLKLHPKKLDGVVAMTEASDCCGYFVGVTPVARVKS
jgi:hypothetical protein